MNRARDNPDQPDSCLHPYPASCCNLPSILDRAVGRTGCGPAALLRPEYQAARSPLYRAVWAERVQLGLFDCGPGPEPLPAQARVMDAAWELVRRHRQAGTLFDERQKVCGSVLEELGTVGYWGLLVDERFGGTGTPFAVFAPFLTRMNTADPTVAALASAHGCLGAVNAVQHFGTGEQQERFLPALARGERLSAFALTEPNAGSDLTALRTRACRQGDHLLVSGEKLFVTNAAAGRTLALVCLLDGRPAVLIAELPDATDESVRLTSYGLHALRHAENHGLVFDDFRVPAANLLPSPTGQALSIVYHGINRARAALCATAAGRLRQMLAEMVPWAKFRHTYGRPIGERELVRRRLGRLAGLIVACDALVAWCAALLDGGYRAELECIVAKVFAADALREAAVELLMKTHGGRALLHGHFFGDNVHDFLAPSIYEGESELLGLALFRSLVRPPRSAVGLPPTDLDSIAPPTDLASELQPYAAQAVDALEAIRRELVELRQTPSPQLDADRQCQAAELSARLRQASVVLCTCWFASRQPDAVIRRAAAVISGDLLRELTGQRPTGQDFQATVDLGTAILDGAFAPIAGLAARDILLSYEP